MNAITINEALILAKAVRERANDLKRLRSEVAKKESYLYGKDEKKVVEPQYDVKAVDRKIMDLERFIFTTETAIKVSNAKSLIELDFNTDTLLAPLQ